MYTSSSLGATTARELNGWRMLQANMTRPANEWVGRADEHKSGEVLLNMQMNVPVNFSGATGNHTLLNIVNGHTQEGHDETEKSQIRTFALEVKQHIEHMAKATTKDRSRKQPWVKRKRFNKTLRQTREHIDMEQPFNQYSFKQFRDAAEPNNACYQALTNTVLKLSGIKLEESSELLHLHIYRFPTQPIVDMLGLKVKTTHKDHNGVYDAVQAIRPFSFVAEGESELGEDICWSTERGSWLRNSNVMERLFSPAMGNTPGMAGAGFAEAPVDGPNSGSDARPASTVPANLDTESQAREVDSEDADSKGRLKKKAEIVPQMLVNGILSSGWRATDSSNKFVADLPDYVFNVQHYGNLADAIFPQSQRVPGQERLWAPYKTPKYNKNQTDDVDELSGAGESEQTSESVSSPVSAIEAPSDVGTSGASDASQQRGDQAPEVDLD